MKGLIVFRFYKFRVYASLALLEIQSMTSEELEGFPYGTVDGGVHDLMVEVVLYAPTFRRAAHKVLICTMIIIEI